MPARAALLGSADHRVAIVIPAFNEGRTIRPLATAALRSASAVVVVDDGSSDGTSPSLEGLGIALHRHPTNRGKAQALRTGFAVALEMGCRGVITMDADGQHDPADLRLICRLASRRPDDLIIGARRRTVAQPRLRRWANRFADFWVSWAAGQPIADSQSGLRYYPARVLQHAFNLSDGGFAFESAVLIEASLVLGTRIRAVAIPARYLRDARPSHFRPVRDILAITRTVARYLLRRGARWQRLRRAWRPPALRDLHAVSTP